MDPTYTPGSEHEEQELFEAKQTFMFSVFNANLQTDMGKTIVRRHLANTDAQSVRKELSEHMRTSSKGASEKRRLTEYVANTVLDDTFKGSTEQFVLDGEPPWYNDPDERFAFDTNFDEFGDCTQTNQHHFRT